MKLVETTRHIDKDGCCAVKDCWSTATHPRERYDGWVVIHYCRSHAVQARLTFGREAA